MEKCMLRSTCASEPKKAEVEAYMFINPNIKLKLCKNCYKQHLRIMALYKSGLEIDSILGMDDNQLDEAVRALDNQNTIINEIHWRCNGEDLPEEYLV